MYKSVIRRASQQARERLRLILNTSSYRLWQPPGFDGLNLERVATDAVEFPKRYLTHYSFTLGLGGPGRITYRGAHLTVPGAHEVFFMQPGEVWAGSSIDGGWKYETVLISPELMGQMLQALDHSDAPLPYFPHYHLGEARRQALLGSHLHAVFQSFSEPSSRLERESKVLRALDLLLEHGAKDGVAARPILPEPQAVRRVREHLQDHMGQDPTLDDLVSVAHLSKYHLLRVFQRELGLSPHGYLTSLRIARAKTLLAAGQPPVHVASDVGFVDQSHLNRVFKKYTLVTPGQYQRDSRG